MDPWQLFEKSIAEAALWCSLQELTTLHQDSPEEARRRELLKESGRLMAKYHSMGRLRKIVPAEHLWNRAMELLQEADPGSLAPLNHQLRSYELRPALSIGELIPEEARQQIVDSLLERRSDSIRSRLTLGADTPKNEAVGRLLLYVPCENIADGASKFASSGFFDDFDTPPWDIWVGYSDRTLVSWVPDLLIPLVQAGIDANAVDCIQWGD